MRGWLNKLMETNVENLHRKNGHHKWNQVNNLMTENRELPQKLTKTSHLIIKE